MKLFDKLFKRKRKETPTVISRETETARPTSRLNKDDFNTLQEKIEQAKAQGLSYVKQQIMLLQDAHDEFVRMAKAKGYDLRNIKVAEIEIQQYSAMRHLAESIGLPTGDYDKMIWEVKVRVFGEENTRNFFGDPPAGCE